MHGTILKNQELFLEPEPELLFLDLDLLTFVAGSGINHSGSTTLVETGRSGSKCRSTTTNAFYTDHLAPLYYSYFNFNFVFD